MSLNLKGSILVLLALTAAATPATNGTAAPSAPATTPSRVPFANYEALLLAAVKGDRVDYQVVGKRSADLLAFVQENAQLDPARFANFTRDQQLAYYLNAYNARVLQVLSQSAVKSIMDIPGVFDKQTFTLNRQEITLNDLENKLIRAQFKEPRIHFALNCGARSCPALQNRPFRAETLEKQLDDGARAFLKRSDALSVDLQTGDVKLSKIFEWFEQDFTGGSSRPRPGLKREQEAVLYFVSRHVSSLEWQKHLAIGPVKLSYMDYDWARNGT